MSESKREKRTSSRRVFLDASTPSNWAVIRVVVLVFVIWSVAAFLENLLFSLKSVFFLIVLSVFFAYLIDPLVRAIRRPFKERHLEKIMPRSVAIIIAYILVFAVVGIAAASIAPKVTDQLADFGRNLPGYADSLQKSVAELNKRYDRMRIPDAIQNKLNETIGGLLGEISNFVSSVIVGGVLIGAVSSVPWLILIPVLSFFFLKDVNFFRLSLLRLFPSGRWRGRAELVLADVNSTLAAYTRAQILSCIIIGLLCTLGFYLLGVRYAVLLGILAAVFEFVPLIGPLTLAIIAITVASFSGSASQGFWVFGYLAVLRLVHDYITYPRIVRDGIHLPPLAIILSVLAGEQIAGIAGVFLSIPIVAIGVVLYKHFLEHRGSRGIVAEWLEEKEKPVEIDETVA